MALESTNQRAIWLGLAPLLVRLFRLNTGRAWISGMGPKGVRKLQDGSVQILAARSIALGFADVKGDPIAGAADLPGWTTIHITPELAQQLIGRNIAVFTSMEIKHSTTGRASPEQLNWQAQVRGAGGIAGIVRSLEEAKAVVSEWIAGKIS